MISLTELITIWPDPRDLMMAGSKLSLEFLIREAAAFINHSHPLSVVVTPTVDTIEQIIDGKVAAALKREFSSHGNHVFTQHTPNAVHQFKKRLEEESRAYRLTCCFPHPLWYLTPYNAPLIYLGEIRVFLVNGILFHSVVTTPKKDNRNDLDIMEPLLFNPLSKLR